MKKTLPKRLSILFKKLQKQYITYPATDIGIKGENFGYTSSTINDVYMVPVKKDQLIYPYKLNEQQKVVESTSTY